MKKIVSFLLIFSLLVAFPFAAFAENEGTLKFTPPTKRVYTVGETPDYSGGLAIYTTHTEYRFTLSSKNCTGLSTAVPGTKTVTVSVATDAPKAYFTVTVLSNDEPIQKMKDITKSHWAYKIFAATMKAGFFAGDTNYKLRPDSSITRAEMASLLYRIYKNDPRVMIDNHPNAAKSFKDVSKSAWYYEAVEGCRKAGLIYGDDTGRFNPNAKITRQDAVLMLMRIQYTESDLASVDVNKTVAASGLNPKDFGKTSAYAKKAMALALGNIIKGDSKGNINPLKTISRAEVASILNNLFLGDYEWTPPVVETPKPNPSTPSKPGTEDAPLIFLSPSSQFANRYAAGNTNEGTQMNLLAQVIKQKLEAKGYRVYLPSSDTTYQERAALSNQVGADIHIPIHSNAGGGTGTRIFYNGARSGSYELSKAIFDELGWLTGTPENHNTLKEDYLSLMPNGSPFHEIAVPLAEMAYLEVEFHDIPEKALWIINHRDQIAEAIANGIDAYCKKYL